LSGRPQLTSKQKRKLQQFGNNRQYCNTTVIWYEIAYTTLENGNNKRKFPSIGEDKRANNELKSMKRDIANAKAQFFRMSS
jgi:hypothetical protein